VADLMKKLRRLSTVGHLKFTRCTRRRLLANAHDSEWVADYGTSHNCWKKLSTSVVVVKKKLRRLSTVGSHDSVNPSKEATREGGLKFSVTFCL